MPFDSLAALRKAMVAEVPHLGAIDRVPENAWTPLGRAAMSGGDFVSGVREHFLANPVQRASEVMADLARLASERTHRMAAE